MSQTCFRQRFIELSVGVYMQLASVRKMFVELDGGLKSVRAAIVKTQEEVPTFSFICAAYSEA